MTDPDAEIVLTLPDELRSAFEEPLGPVFVDPERLLRRVEGALVAVGDIVTYHFERMGRTPDVAVVDGLTEREGVADEVARQIEGSDATRLMARNPAATLSVSVLETLRTAIDREGPIVVDVDGEEDLVTLPAIVATPEGTSVVYGQPGEGMVHVVVTDDVKAGARTLLERMEGDHERARELVGADG